MPRWPGGTTPRIRPPVRPSRPCSRADMVGLVHQLDPAALVRRLPRLGTVAALETEAQAALGEVPAEQLTTGQLTTGQLTTRRRRADRRAADCDAVERGPQDLGGEQLLLDGFKLQPRKPVARLSQIIGAHTGPARPRRNLDAHGGDLCRLVVAGCVGHRGERRDRTARVASVQPGPRQTERRARPVERSGTWASPPPGVISV